MTPDWWERALCRELDPEIFFPEQRGGIVRDVEYAKSFCRVCLVRQDCLDYALSVDDRFGIFGGLTHEERKQLRTEKAA